MASWWQNLTSDSNKLVTLAWFSCLFGYIGFRIANINAPELTNAFVTITGIWVGNLGLAQTKKTAEKTAKVEEKADHAVAVAETAKDTVETATGGMVPIIQDPNTGDLRAQRPPQIARENDRRSTQARTENDRRSKAFRDENDTREKIARDENDLRDRIARGEDDNNV